MSPTDRRPPVPQDGETSLPDGWSRAGQSISRTFSFRSYPEGLAFVGKVAALAEGQDHHPNMLLEYRRVTVSYTTHDAGGVTLLDLEAAASVNALL